MIRDAAIAACIALALACAWLGWQVFDLRRHAAFVAEQRAAYPGHRLEYAPAQAVLVLLKPDGGRDVVALDKLERIGLYRIRAVDAVGDRDREFWQFTRAGVVQSLPYYAVDPRDVVSFLRDARPDLDAGLALRRSDAFERGDFDLCTLWSAPGVAEIRPADGYTACAP